MVTQSKKTLVRPVLSFEIIIEILSWLSVESLLRCKCVCKQWCALIEDRYFIEKHLIRSEGISISYHSQEGNQETFALVTDRDGLILERSNVSQKYRIRNPATRQIFDLPNPHENNVGMSFAFAPTSGYYKAISIYDCEDETKGIEVLSLGADDQPSWRSLDVPCFPCFDKGGQEKGMLMFSGWVLYCVRMSKDGSRNHEIVSLDLDTEKFACTVLPWNLYPDCNEVWVLIWQDCLSFAKLVQHYLHILSLREKKNGKWGQVINVIPLKFLEDKPDMRKGLELCSAFYSVLWFKLKENNTIISYDIVEEKIVHESPSQGTELSFMIKPSLVTFKGMRPE